MNKETIKDLELGKGDKRVFDYMIDFGSITSLQAFTDLGETRLSARIYNLKKKGIGINDKRISVKNRYGESRFVKVYSVLD